MYIFLCEVYIHILKMHFTAGTSACFTFVYSFSSYTKELLSPCHFLRGGA